MKLIFIHGRAQEDYDEQELKEKWIHELKLGLEKSKLTLPEDVKIEFPYYGKLLIQLVGEAKAPETIIEARRTGSNSPSESEQLEFYENYLKEIVQELAVNREDKKILNQLETTRSGSYDWVFINKLLKFIDNKNLLGSFPIQLFTEDVFMYLKNGSIKNKINKAVQTVFDSEECVVVGHSLGSIISYLILKNNPNYNVKKFITIGSPLGVNSIRPFLEEPLVMPTCVKDGWFNAFDKRDIVALHPLDKIYFNIKPAIENKSDVDNVTDNRHGMEGYLSDAEVAQRIYQALKKQ